MTGRRPWDRFPIPRRLAENCSQAPERAAWLERLPGVVDALAGRWSLRLAAPFDGPEGSCAWAAPVTLEDGSAAVLKVGMPHMEAEHEIDGLRVWDGDPTVRLLAADPGAGAMLLERCHPGTALRELPEPAQDEVIATLLRRLWRPPPSPHPFRPLAEMLAHWRAEALARSHRWTDPGLVRAGLGLFDELAQSASSAVLLATDLHAGNVLRAEREPWLVIDPKPFVGDPAYDATQHLLNCKGRLARDPFGTIRRFADLLELDAERVRLWLFARLAAESGSEDESGSGRIALTRALAP